MPYISQYGIKIYRKNIDDFFHVEKWKEYMYNEIQRVEWNERERREQEKGKALGNSMQPGENYLICKE